MMSDKPENAEVELSTDDVLEDIPVDDDMLAELEEDLLEEIEDQTDERDALIAKLHQEVHAQKDAMLRALADSQNMQRRMRQQFEQEKKFAAEGLLREIIPVLDNFDRTLKAAESGSSVESLLEGMAVIDRQLRKALQTAELVQIESVGAQFDPEFHEAIVTLETDETPPDTVVDVIEAGYRIGDRVLRPARVRVSKAPGA